MEHVYFCLGWVGLAYMWVWQALVWLGSGAISQLDTPGFWHAGRVFPRSGHGMRSFFRSR